MNFNEAIKRPFTDFKKLILGILISIVPIVNFMAYGYYLNCAKTVMGKKKDYKLPEWTGFGSLFINGLLAVIISLIYFIPAAIIFFVAIGFAAIRNILISGMTDFSDILPRTGIFTGIIVLIITAFLLPIAILNFINKNKFSAAFNFSEIFKKAFTSSYFIAWFVGILITVVLGIILSFIPFIGPPIASFISGVILYTLVGEAYSGIK